MTAPFNPPSTQGKPAIPKWVPPEPTKEDLDWASIHTLDLSLLDSKDPQVVSGLVALAKTAVKEDGFLYLVNYGISQEQLDRQFDLAQHLHSNITEEEKDRLLMDPKTGRFSGFKRRAGWMPEGDSMPDGIEQFNFYSSQFDDPALLPECIKPFFDEITAFSEYLTYSVNRRLLRLLSNVLELPDNYLWDSIQSHEGVVGEGYYRHALFYPLSEEDRTKRKGMRMGGHSDYGTTTLLFSVPVTALHIFTRNKRWQPVKYERGALVVNLGDALEIISGGHFRATLHKVMNTPKDQQQLQRLSLVQFNACRGNLKLKPALASPLLQREGLVQDQFVFGQYKALMDNDYPVPTMKEWRELLISSNVRVYTGDRPGGTRIVDGVKYGAQRFHGIDVLIPV